MKVEIHDVEALRAVSPTALSAWAYAAGWCQTGTYRKHSDIYEASGKPEIVLPRTPHLGDYATVVSDLIRIFAEDAGRDELSLYRDLVIADRDVVRLRAIQGDDGSVALKDGVELVQGTHDLLLATACSLWGSPQPLYRAAAHQEAVALLGKMRLGQTDQGSFIVNVLTPPVRPPNNSERPHWSSEEPDEDPNARRMTQRLVEAMTAIRSTVTNKTSGKEGGTYQSIVRNGVSANLCEALVRIIEPFAALDIGIGWAKTSPMKEHKTKFYKKDEEVVKSLAEDLRAQKVRPNMRLRGQVHRLTRVEEENYRNIYLHAKIDGKTYSVAAKLNQTDYDIAVQAHKDKGSVVLEGNLGRVGQRWHLHDAKVVPSASKA